MSSTHDFWHTLRFGLKGKCPKCFEGDIYPSLISFTLKDRCECCGLDFSKNDNADGPAVFVMGVLCFVVVPAALALDMTIQPPIWVHAILWSFVTLVLAILGLKPMTGYVMSLQYKHRPRDFDETGDVRE